MHISPPASIAWRRTSVLHAVLLLYLFIYFYYSPFFGSRFSQKRLGLRTPNLVAMYLGPIRRLDISFKGVAPMVSGQKPKMCMHCISYKGKVY
jgi:hypothetical protein